MIIISDAGLRGEDRDETITEGRAGWARENVQVLDARTVMPKEPFHSVYVTEIGFVGVHIACGTNSRFVVIHLGSTLSPLHFSGISARPSNYC